MSKYTYYVFIDGQHWTAQPVFTGRRESMDRQAEQFGKDNGFMAAIGPFRTRRAADFMVKHGYNNPHLRTVADAERISREQA